jgi:hypothetical protein
MSRDDTQTLRRRIHTAAERCKMEKKTVKLYEYELYEMSALRDNWDLWQIKQLSIFKKCAILKTALNTITYHNMKSHECHHIHVH